MHKFKNVLSMFSNLTQTLFPDLCLACNRMDKVHLSHFCISCLTTLPLTDHFEVRSNPVTMHLAGRIALHHGAALLTFKKGSIVQNMLHQFKYKKRNEVGEILGRMAALKFSQSKLFQKPDVIIPVPIHSKKERIRGYNQSAIFGRSVGEYLNVECLDKVLIKVIKNQSQTGKSRTERVINVTGGFEVVRPMDLQNKHILLVDDVITTGATLEACCQCIYGACAETVSILCIAVAES